MPIHSLPLLFESRAPYCAITWYCADTSAVAPCRLIACTVVMQVPSVLGTVHALLKNELVVGCAPAQASSPWVPRSTLSRNLFYALSRVNE